jgi:hypothetical protein
MSRYQVSHSYRTTDKIIISYTLIFMILVSRWEDKKWIHRCTNFDYLFYLYIYNGTYFVIHSIHMPLPLSLHKGYHRGILFSSPPRFTNIIAHIVALIVICCVHHFPELLIKSFLIGFESSFLIFFRFCRSIFTQPEKKSAIRQ